MASDEETRQKELMDKYGIPEEEQRRVFKVLAKNAVSLKHFEFYLRSFKFFDRDPEDNTIKQNELVNALRCFGLNPTSKDVEELCQEFDTNKSQLIELSEFIEMTRVILDKHDPSALENAFAFFDTNKDGFISADELKRAMKDHGEPMTDEEIQEMLEELDIDNDNKINVHEFIALLKSFDHL